MAIKKETQHGSGVVTDYHRIDAMQWSRTGDYYSVIAVIGAYLSKAAAEAGCAPVESVHKEASLPMAGGEPTRAMLYERLTAPVAMHSYDEEEFGDRDDGSRGPVTTTRTIENPVSVTGFNDCAAA